MRRNNLSSPTEDRKYVFNLFKLEKERSQTALVAGANSISFVNVATSDRKWLSAALNDYINWQETKLIFQPCLTKVVTIERMDTIEDIFWTFLFVYGRKQDFLHFGIDLVVFVLKFLPDVSIYSVKSFVVNVFVLIFWICMIMVRFTFATFESLWHFALSWNLGVMDIKINFGELNSFPKEQKAFIRLIWLEHLRRFWPMIVLLLQTSQVFEFFFKDCLFETTDVSQVAAKQEAKFAHKALDNSDMSLRFSFTHYWEWPFPKGHQLFIIT